MTSLPESKSSCFVPISQPVCAVKIRSGALIPYRAVSEMVHSARVCPPRSSKTSCDDISHKQDEGKFSDKVVSRFQCILFSSKDLFIEYKIAFFSPFKDPISGWAKVLK